MTPEECKAICDAYNAKWKCWPPGEGPMWYRAKQKAKLLMGVCGIYAVYYKFQRYCDSLTN
jgi:hypothetical protein